MVIPVGMGAEEEGTWEMGVKECAYVYSVCSVLGIVISIYSFL